MLYFIKKLQEVCVLTHLRWMCKFNRDTQFYLARDNRSNFRSYSLIEKKNIPHCEP